MAGLGGRRALELLAQGLVEVLAEDRQVQQQQTSLQQQAFQAGLAAAGVLVRPEHGQQRALPQQQFLQQQATLQQVPMQMIGPGQFQYVTAPPGPVMAMTGQGPAPCRPTTPAAAATPIVEEMHSPSAPEIMVATSKSKPTPPPQNAEQGVSTPATAAAAAAVAPSPAPVAPGSGAGANEIPAGAEVPAPAPPTGRGVREVSLTPSDCAETSPAEDQESVVRVARYRAKSEVASTTATSARGRSAVTLASSSAREQHAGSAPANALRKDSDDSTPARRAAGQGFEIRCFNLSISATTLDVICCSGSLPGPRDDEARPKRKPKSRSRSRARRRGTKGKKRRENEWYRERHPERMPPPRKDRRERRVSLDDEDL